MATPRMQFTSVRASGKGQSHALALPLANLGRAACGKRSKRWVVSALQDAKADAIVGCIDCKRMMGLPCRKR